MEASLLAAERDTLTDKLQRPAHEANRYHIYISYPSSPVKELRTPYRQRRAALASGSAPVLSRAASARTTFALRLDGHTVASAYDMMELLGHAEPLQERKDARPVAAKPKSTHGQNAEIGT
jgi:hypothetical protein